jgi:hypothetical protein
MDKKFNGTTVETNGIRSIAGGGTGAATAEQARVNLGIPAPPASGTYALRSVNGVLSWVAV